MKPRNTPKRSLASFAATTAALASLAAAAAAHAETAQKDHEVQPISGIVQTEPSGSSPPAAAPEVRTVSYLGHAPYVCSPSGFGARSKCVLRSSLKVRSR